LSILGSGRMSPLQALVAFESVTPSSSSRAGCPSPATRPVRALRCEPAACRQHPALASRGRGACGPTPGAGIIGQGGMGWTDAGGGKGCLIFLSPGCADGHVDALGALCPRRSHCHGRRWRGLTWGAALFRCLKRAGEHLYRNIPGEGLLTYALTKGQDFARVRKQRLRPER
jgi:hypothetical protein